MLLAEDASAKVAEGRSNELKVQTLSAEVEGVRAQLKKIEDEAHGEQHHLHREAPSLGLEIELIAILTSITASPCKGSGLVYRVTCRTYRAQNLKF